VEESNNIVFFGGAGVSTESGIPDFRGANGLYHKSYHFPPEIILSHSFFISHTVEFFKFYKEWILKTDIKPNIAHSKLAELEASGKLRGIITQNIDGLHQKAGSRHVCELHGSILRNFCMRCGEFHSVQDIDWHDEVPICKCNGVIKPDVVLYEEALDEKNMNEAIHLISQADILIVGGTSLSVYPAAGFIKHYKGDKMVLINQLPTPYDDETNLLIQTRLGEVFSRI
jgi:NAD-dependent deacetylase